MSYQGPREGFGDGFIEINYFDSETNTFGFVLRVPLNLLKYIEDFMARLATQKNTKIDKSVDKQGSINSLSPAPSYSKIKSGQGGQTEGAALLNNLFSGIKGTVNRKDAEMVFLLYLDQHS